MAITGENNPAKRPEVRIKLKAALIKRYKDPAARKKASLAAKKRYTNPKQHEVSSVAAIKKWQDPKYRAKFIGEQNGRWDGGTGNKPYPNEFNSELKDSIRERDNNTCQICDKTEEQNGKRLAIHHIDYIKEHCNPENLITLCNSCNSKVNSNRNYWQAVLTEKNK